MMELKMNQKVIDLEGGRATDSKFKSLLFGITYVAWRKLMSAINPL